MRSFRSFLTGLELPTRHVYLISVSPNPKPALTPVTQRDKGFEQEKE